jgi:hypothetical protein
MNQRPESLSGFQPEGPVIERIGTQRYITECGQSKGANQVDVGCRKIPGLSRDNEFQNYSSAAST